MRYASWAQAGVTPAEVDKIDVKTLTEIEEFMSAPSRRDTS